jgi:hypothetical protein
MKSSAQSPTPLAELEPPIRLLEGGGSAFERRLLESARGDCIPAASLEQLARELRVPSECLQSLPARSLGEVLRASQLTRYGSFLGVGGLGLVAALAFSRTPAPVAFNRASPASVEAPLRFIETTPVAAPPSLVPASSVSLAAAGPATMSEPAASQPAEPVATPPVIRKSRSSVRSRALAARTEPSPAPSAPSPVAGGLRAELLALETVQNALRAGRTPEAARALADYGRRFPHAELALEAELLGIDLLLARGEREQARTQARELLARPAAARYRERLEALSDGARDLANTPRSGANLQPVHIDGRR